MEYPEGNPGVWPVEVESPVGKFRLLSGDVLATAYDPEYPGYRSFERFSDAEIGAYLSQGSYSIPRAVGYSFLYLAGQAAFQSKSVKDQDLQVDLTKRSGDFRALANMYFALADEEDALLGEGDFFDVFPTGATGEFIPEGTLPIYGRKYTWDRWR